MEVGNNQNLSCLSNSYDSESSYETISQSSLTIAANSPCEKKTVVNDNFAGYQFTGCAVQSIFDFERRISCGQQVIAFRDPSNFVHDDKLEEDLWAALT